MRLEATDLVVVLPGVQVHQPLAPPELRQSSLELVHPLFALSQRAFQRPDAPLDVRAGVENARRLVTARVHVPLRGHVRQERLLPQPGALAVQGVDVHLVPGENLGVIGAVLHGADASLRLHARARGVRGGSLGGRHAFGGVVRHGGGFFFRL